MRFFSKEVFIVTVIIFAMNTKCIQAQNGAKNPVSTINPVSPTTAELLKYVDFNVSSSTGVPDITIPLLEVKGKKLSLPISISYNASGIKVNQQAGNVGLAWSLNAGGMISCAIRGKKDDQSYWINVPGPVNDGFDPATSLADFNLAKGISEKTIDGAPDLYSYNFGNYSGKFMDIIGRTPNILMIPKKPLAITRYATVPASGYTNFKVVAEDGTLYFFEAIEKTDIRTSYGISESGFTNYLTKILSADRTDSITFTYEDTYYEDLPALGESFSYIFSACTIGNDVTSGSSPDTYFTSSSRMSGKQLKRIVFSEGSVDFTISYNRQDTFGDPTNVKNPKIDRIILKNLAGAELKTISFNYSYYNPNSSSLYAKRLKLNQIDICPQSGLCGNAQYTNSYKFTYNSTILPALNSFAQDHWGYYNGQKTNTTFLPSYPINLTPVTCYTNSPFCPCTPNVTNRFTGANRNSSRDSVKVGILEKIEYPTGGNIQFSFETNQTAPLTYILPVAKSVTAEIYSNPNNTGFDYMVSSVATVPLSQSVCAKISIGVGYPGGTNPTNNKSYAEFWEATPDGDFITKIATYTNLIPATVNEYNVTLAAGKYYAMKVIARIQNASINASIGYSIPQSNTIPYYVGGLRLKQKTVYDHVSATSSITTYTYSPATFKNPNYEQLSWRYVGPLQQTCGEPCDGSHWPPDMYDVKKYTTLISTNGGIDNEVNYSEITTVYGASGENGKTITHFTSYNNDYFWRRGSIDDQQDFNAAGKLLRKVVNHYTVHPNSSEINQGLEVSATYSHPCMSPATFTAYSKFGSYKPTFNPTEWFYQDTTTTYEYDTQTSNVKKTKTFFVYLNSTHMQLNQTHTTNSLGKNVTAFVRYPLDYGYGGTVSGSAAVMKELTNRHIYTRPIEEVNFGVSNSSPTVLQTSAVLHTYKLNNNQIVKDSDYRLKYTNGPGTNTEPVSNYAYASVPSGQLIYDARYELENQYSRFDLNQNLIELKQQDNTYTFRSPVNGEIWAETKHAIFDETAYSSFEHGSIANDFTGWNYNNANVFTDAAPPPARGTFNGIKCYRFPNTSDIISNRATLNSNQRFKISFWGKGGSVIVNGIPYPVFSPTAFNIPLRTGPTRMGWTYYEAYFSGAIGVQLNGTGMIDELRLYPASARMETYVYKQGIGIWSKCNENNQNTFWDYDEFQRLRLTTDQDGYILNKNEYKYLQPQN